MTLFDAQLVDELRREYRRTQPPPAMLAHALFEPCICHIIMPDKREGFRIIWKRKDRQVRFETPIYWQGYTLTILQLL